MEPIAINQRKNEKWQSIEVAKEYYNSLKLVKLYKTAFLAADAVFAFIIGYKLIAGKNDNLTLFISLFVACLLFSVWIFVKPIIDGNRMYLESVLANGEDHISESRIYADRIEYYSEDREQCSSIPLDRVYNAFETEHLYEIQLIDDEKNMIGHMLLKSGFVKGSLEEVKKLIPPGQRTLPDK